MNKIIKSFCFAVIISLLFIGIKCLCDPIDLVEEDGIITQEDILKFIESWHSTPDDPNWNPLADVNGDAIIDVNDFTQIAELYYDNVPIFTPTEKPTLTQTQIIPTSTNTPLSTNTQTPLPTNTLTVTMTYTDTPTPTITNTFTPVPPTFTFTPSYTPTNAPPEVVLDVTPPLSGSAPLTVGFIGSATDTDGLISSYSWLFDLNVSNLFEYVTSAQSITSVTDFTYYTPGIYQVVFSVTDTDNAVNSATESIVIWTNTPTSTNTPLPATYTFTPTNTPVETPVAGPTIIINLPGNVPLVMVKIPAGSFEMGSPNSDSWASSSEKPQHMVNIGYDFYMGKTEVTQKQWFAVMGDCAQLHLWSWR